MSGIGKIAVRRVHTGNFGVDQQQRLAQQAAVVSNSHRDMLNALVNRSYIAVVADTTLATSASYATLLSASITTVLATGYIIVTFTGCSVHITNAGTTSFQVLVDGVVQKGCYSTYGTAGYGACFALTLRVPVTRGAHTVLLQWKTNANSARIGAVTYPEEHASLLVQEAA